VGLLSLVAVVDAVSHDEVGAVRFHYTIIDYAGRWTGGEARPGGDVTEVAWALPGDLPGFDLTPEALRVIALARTRL
jgi:8-oxo-dGTP diphosphatase